MRGDAALIIDRVICELASLRVITMNLADHVLEHMDVGVKDDMKDDMEDREEG